MTTETIFRSDPTFLREDRVGPLLDTLTQIAKRAAKLGVEAPGLEFTGRDEIRSHTRADGTPIKVRFVEVVVTGETPRFPGWSLVAVVSHDDGVVDVVPGETCPPNQRDRGPVCDHCQRRQPNRKKTMVLRSTDDGRIVQVGTTCIGDFLGTLKFDPQLALTFAASLFSLIADLGGNEDLDGTDHDAPCGSRLAPVEDIETVLEWTGGWLHDNGWVSGGRAWAEGSTPTKSHVASLLWPPRFTGRNADELRREYEESKAKAEAAITDELRAEVTAAIEWVKAAAAADEANDYLAACATLATNRWVKEKRFGYACSILPSYRRHLGQLEEAAAKTPDLNEHCGTVGERVTLDLRVVAPVRPIESDFGTTFLHTFKDAEGRVCKTFASKRLADRGDHVVVKATVKRHSVFNGNNETQLGRVAVIADRDPQLSIVRELLRGDVARPADDEVLLSLGTAVKFLKRTKVWRLK